MLQDLGYRASASHSVPVYILLSTLHLLMEGWPGWVDLVSSGGWLHTKMVYLPSASHLSKY